MTSTVSGDIVVRLRREVGDALQQERTRMRNSGRQLTGEDERELTRALIWDAVRGWATEELASHARTIEQAAQEQVHREVWAAMYQADRLQLLLDDRSVENVNINGCDAVFVKYADGRKVRLDGTIAESDEALIAMVRRMAGWVGLSSRPWDFANPWLRLRLPGGERLTAIAWVCERPTISIRRSLHPQMGLPELVRFGTCSELAAEVLKRAVLARRTLVAAGDQGSGKTTLVRALIKEVSPLERILSAEASLELDIAGIGVHEDVVELEARDGYGSATGAVGLEDLVRMMLTQDADRCIVGECTGPEVIALLNATLGGAGGSLTTIHARHAKGVPNRIAAFAAQAKERLSREASLMLVAEALDLVVYMKVLRNPDGSKRRVITDIVEVGTYDNGRIDQSTLFEWNPAAGQAEPVSGGANLMAAACMPRLIEAGFDPYRFGLRTTGWQA